jgi:hypothetical protein
MSHLGITVKDSSSIVSALTFVIEVKTTTPTHIHIRDASNLNDMCMNASALSEGWYTSRCIQHPSFKMWQGLDLSLLVAFCRTSSNTFCLIPVFAYPKIMHKQPHHVLASCWTVSKHQLCSHISPVRVNEATAHRKHQTPNHFECLLVSTPAPLPVVLH